jgi:hypothetical protein
MQKVPEVPKEAKLKISTPQQKRKESPLPQLQHEVDKRLIARKARYLTTCIVGRDLGVGSHLIHWKKQIERPEQADNHSKPEEQASVTTEVCSLT